MSRTQQRWAFILILVFAVVVAACQPSPTPTPTPRPTDTTVPTVAATTEATAAVTAAATTEATAAVTAAATTEATAAVTAAATTEATAAVTAAATSEATTAATAAATAEATSGISLLPATVEVTAAATTEATAEATAAPTSEVTAEATVPLGTIIDVAKADGHFTTLLAALDKAGLTDTLNGAGPYTVFAPTDDAFQAFLTAGNMTAAELLDNADLANILKYHVVSGKVTADQLAQYHTQDNPDLILIPTLDGDKLITVTFAADGTITLNGTAKVTLKNVQASNGIIHVIDAVLTAPTAAATAEATMAATAEATAAATAAVALVPTTAATAEMTAAATAASTPEATMAPTTAATTEATSSAIASGSSLTIAPDGTLVIGLAAGLSGEGIASLGIDIQRGAELALADRPMVTVGGKTFNVKLDVQDDQCSADGGQAVANRFASASDVVGLVGPMCSSACRAAAPILDAAHYTSVSPSCTAPDLTTSGYTSFNRSVVSDAFQGAIAANYVYTVLGIHSIATIHDGSPYGEGLVSVVAQTFEALGGTVVSSDAVAVGDTDFRGLLDDIAQKNPGLIYFGGFPAEAARLIQQRADAGLEKVPFMGADGINGTEVIKLAGESSEGVYATQAIAASSQALTDFLSRYVKAYGEEPPAPYHATAYDGVNILLDAVQAVGKLDASGNLVISRDDIQKYVRSLKNFQGLTGVLNADGTGDTSLADIGIFQVTNGAFVQLYTGKMVDGVVQLTAYVAPTPEATAAVTAEATAAATAEATMAATAAATPEATAAATEASIGPLDLLNSQPPAAATAAATAAS